MVLYHDKLYFSVEIIFLKCNSLISKQKLTGKWTHINLALVFNCDKKEII